jgi:hypothetical protein
MEPGGSLPPTQQPANRPHPEPDLLRRAKWSVQVPGYVKWFVM